jgi:hypothetical protein
MAVRPEHAAVELEQPARLFRWLFETSDIVAGGRDPGFDDDLQQAILGA